MPSAAVFDLDKTLVRGSSLFHFGRFLVRRRALHLRHVARFAWAQHRYERGAGENPEATSRATVLALSLLEGVSEVSMRHLIDEFVSVAGARILNPAIVDEVRRQQANEVPCYIATASPQELAEAFALRLGMAGAFGTVAEVLDGAYTGRLSGPACHGSAKARRVSVGLARHGLDLSVSVAYSDSVNDLPLLAASGRPVAVNADHELMQIAVRNGWPVIPGPRDQRRDVQSLMAYLPFPI